MSEQRAERTAGPSGRSEAGRGTVPDPDATTQLPVQDGERTQALPTAARPGDGPGRSAAPHVASDPARPAPRGETPSSRVPAKGGPTGPRVGPGRSGSAGGAGPRTRRARLAVRRIDPWSVFVTSLLTGLFLAVVTLVAVFALYQVLAAAGVQDSLNELYAEVTRESGADAAEPAPLLTSGRVLGLAALLAAFNVVLLTVLATLFAVIYNVCASFTGGVEVTLAERD